LGSNADTARKHERKYIKYPTRKIKIEKRQEEEITSSNRQYK